MWQVWEDRRGAHRALVGRPGRKKQLARPRRRWEDNIEKCLSRHRMGV